MLYHLITCYRIHIPLATKKINFSCMTFDLLKSYLLLQFFFFIYNYYYFFKGGQRETKYVCFTPVKKKTKSLFHRRRV